MKAISEMNKEFDAECVWLTLHLSVDEVTMPPGTP